MCVWKGHFDMKNVNDKMNNCNTIENNKDLSTTNM
jgi:hypothetical protein